MAGLLRGVGNPTFITIGTAGVDVSGFGAQVKASMPSTTTAPINIPKIF
jgi:hypothetical protein